MTRISAFMICVGFLLASRFAAAQSGDDPPSPVPPGQVVPAPQPGPRYQPPRQYYPPLQQDLSRSQIYQNRKAQEAVGTPYGTINGKDYRPQPDEYYTRSRMLHPQVVRGWGYDPNAVDYGPDYNAGVLPADYPVPKRGSNVTFRLPGHGYPHGYGAPPTSDYAPGRTTYISGGFRDIHAPGAEICVRRGRGVRFSVSSPAGYPAVPPYEGFSAEYGYNSQWYLADYNYPNAANQAIVPAGADPYNFHFGDGLHRSGVSGHYRFPYYSYRRPWYYPGDASFQRNTQFPW
ncbi:MAG: hypothetical protein WEB58_00070 [Planctomycetaceae bacterium]